MTLTVRNLEEQGKIGEGVREGRGGKEGRGRGGREGGTRRGRERGKGREGNQDIVY